MAEQSGLIEPIGEWVVEEASRQSRRWQELGIDLTIAFNLSPRQMRQPTVMRRLLDQILAHGADPERLVVELTESVAVESPAHTQLQFREARAGGCARRLTTSAPATHRSAVCSKSIPTSSRSIAR